MMKSLVAVLCLVWLWSGCSSSVSPPDDILGFPLAVGSAWTYAVYDSMTQQGDTVEVSLARRIGSSASRTVYLWRITGRMSSDSLYLIRAGDTLFFCRTPDGGDPSPMFVFPLHIGRGWHWPSADSFTVTAIESVVTPAGAFGACYRIEDRPFIMNFYGGTTYWVARDVGIVRKKENWMDTISMEPRYVIWQLLRYRPGRWASAEDGADPMGWIHM